MTAFKIEKFAGESPRFSDRLLPDNGASDARNCLLTSGELIGLNSPKQIIDLNSRGIIVRKTYRIPDPDGDVWMAWDSPEVDVVKPPLVNDAYDRYYWTGDGAPKYNSLDNIKAGTPGPYKIGMENGDQKPVLSETTAGTGEDETRNYVYTFVNEFGEEGPPCEPTEPETFKSDSVWNISGMSVVPQNHTGRTPIVSQRIYRTTTGVNSGDFRLVAELTPPVSSYDDAATPTEAARGQRLESTSWFPPPDDLVNLTAMANGVLMGTSGRDLYFCEPYRPHAWPAEYVQSVDFDVVGCAPLGSGAAVMTNSRPYKVMGVSSASMTKTKTDTVEPCLSKRSIVTTDDAVFYASPNGLVAVTPGGVDVITNDYMTRKDWNNDFAPSDIIAAQIGLNYIAFTSETAGWAIGLKEPLQRVTKLDRFNAVVGVDTDDYDGRVYLIRNNRVYEWNPEGTIPLGYTWRSKHFVSPRPINLGAARFKLDTTEGEAPTDVVDGAEQYNKAWLARPINAVGMWPVGASAKDSTIKAQFPDVIQTRLPAGGSPLVSLTPTFSTQTLLEVWADGVRTFSKTVYDESIIKLPSGYKAQVWWFSLEGTQRVYSLELAETGKGLSRV